MVMATTLWRNCHVNRYLKQAIVDKNALVSSSALVSGILLYKISPEVVCMYVLLYVWVSCIWCVGDVGSLLKR